MIEESHIKKVVDETGLFRDLYYKYKKEDKEKGVNEKLHPGASIGRYHGPIDKIFPGAGSFMSELIFSSRSSKKDGAGSSVYSFVFPLEIPGVGSVDGMGNAEIGMKVLIVGSTGIQEGTIKAVDASLLIDYLPHQGVSSGDPGFNEPIFSPSPLFGGRFPNDIRGYVRAYVPLYFYTECKTCPYIGVKQGFPKPPRKRALFVEQIITDAKTNKGDSGASLISKDLKYLGLHFAGSGRFSFCNSAENVQYSMNTELIT
jgi:hypothetical protein